MGEEGEKCDRSPLSLCLFCLSNPDFQPMRLFTLTPARSPRFPRNRANAVEGNVEEVVGNLRRANTVLLEARGAIRGSGSSLRFIQERVDEVRDVR